MTTQPTTDMTDRPHLEVIAGALSDWWFTTDPARPFDINVVARAVDARLTLSGYRIVPGSTPVRTTCDASIDTGFTNPAGPCILRAGHDGPVHQDAAGATWWISPPPAPAAPPSRLAVTCFAVLTLACAAGALYTAAYEYWAWAIPVTLATTAAGWATADAYAERRAHHRGPRR
ncbi:hypothetical protein [Streptomyces sp. NPDC048584]|uniref:hypothetical protein n=1 Tax=Streptomyces sp. NPDC048584 TaxID=3365573 RepID=UPI003718F6D6